MTQIIVRYGCDGGCHKYFDNKDDLAEVEIQQFRGLNNGKAVYFTDRFELWCKDCQKKSETPETPEYLGASRTTPGFRING